MEEKIEADAFACGIDFDTRLCDSASHLYHGAKTAAEEKPADEPRVEVEP